MDAALLIPLIAGLFSSADSRQAYVYYGAEVTYQVGGITTRLPFNEATLLICEDGYQSSFSAVQRMLEEINTPGPSSKRGKSEQVKNANTYRRSFPVPRKTATIDVPKCVILWSSGVTLEFPSFSIDVADKKLPMEVKKTVERVLTNPAADKKDLEAHLARMEQGNEEMMRMQSGVASQRPAPSFPSINFPTPSVPPPLPAMPYVPPPSAPGRTTTICRTLSNGTIYCD